MKHLLIVIAILISTLAAKAQDTDNVKKVLETGVEVYTKLKEPPTYVKGAKAFYDFLGSSIRMPAEVRENGLRGTAVVTFIVEEDGTLSGYKILSSPSNAMGEEVIRVMKTSAKWNPGKVDGKPVKFLFNLPVSF